MTTAADDLRKALSAAEGGKLWLRRLAIFGGIAVVIAIGLGWRVTHRPAPPARYVAATVTVGDVIEKVQATGAVQPLLQVNVGAQVNGRVTRGRRRLQLGREEGRRARRDRSDALRQQVTQAQAAVQAQKAQLETAKATLEATKVGVRAHAEALRAEPREPRATSTRRRATTTSRVAAIASANASIASQNAQLSQSKTNVGFTKIYSPVDGVVVTRGIDPGATVVASFQAPVLFVIAQDLRKMRVLADIDEADVGKLKEKMEAEAVVDAFPGEVFHGIVQQVRYSPNTSRGRRHVLGGRRGRQPGREAPPRHDGHGHDQDARSEGGAAHSERGAALSSRLRRPRPTASRVRSRPSRRSRKGRVASTFLLSDKPGDEKDEVAHRLDRHHRRHLHRGHGFERSRRHEDRHRRARRQEEKGLFLSCMPERAHRARPACRRTTSAAVASCARCATSTSSSSTASSSRSSGRAARASPR